MQWLRSYDVLPTLKRCLPPLTLMAIIFVLSAQPDLNSGLGGWDTVLRKLTHAFSFGLLWWLWRRALGRPAIAAAITLAYAVSDEWHQSFVQGRNGSPLDVAIDALGIAVAAALWRRWRRAPN